MSSEENSGVIQIRFTDTENIVVNAPVVLRATIRDEDGMHTAEDKIEPSSTFLFPDKLSWSII